MTTDPLPLAQALLRCPSVTPADAGAQEALAGALHDIGFEVWRLPFGTTANLFARRGTAGPHLCFAGHTDVVPPGPGWTRDPFAAIVADGLLFGRGACDMKGAIAAFAAAAAEHSTGPGSLSLLITGDEEGPATDGTVRVLGWMADRGHIPDLCVVGEPTGARRLGDAMRIGRRGSLVARIAVHGRQGHSAYARGTENAIHRLVAALAAMTAAPLDGGSEWFEPSVLQVVDLEVGNPATNVVPATARATVNIRFNDRHSGGSITAWLKAVLDRAAPEHTLDVSISGESFLTKPGTLVLAVRDAIGRATGEVPRLDTVGGTSDARFISRYCPVCEFGLVGDTMHQVDEAVPVRSLAVLRDAYVGIMEAVGC